MANKELREKISKKILTIFKMFVIKVMCLEKSTAK